MSASFSGVPALLGGLQYTAGNVTGMNAGMQYRDEMRRRNLQAAMDIAAQQQQQMNLDRQRSDQLRMYRDQQARQRMQDALSAQQGQDKTRAGYAQMANDAQMARNKEAFEFAMQKYKTDAELQKARMQGDVTMRGQDIGAATALAGQQTTMRGQDIGAETTRMGQRLTDEYRRNLLKQEEDKMRDLGAYRAGMLSQGKERIENTKDYRKQQLLLDLGRLQLDQQKQGAQQQPKPLSISEQKDLAELQASAASGDPVAQQTLSNMGVPFVESGPIQSQQIGLLERAANAALGYSGWSLMPWGESRAERERRLKSGYTQEGYATEVAALQKRIAQYASFFDEEGKPKEGYHLTPEQEQDYQDTKDRLQELYSNYTKYSVQ